VQEDCSTKSVFLSIFYRCDGIGRWKFLDVCTCARRAASKYWSAAIAIAVKSIATANARDRPAPQPRGQQETVTREAGLAASIMLRARDVTVNAYRK